MQLFLSNRKVKRMSKFKRIKNTPTLDRSNHYNFARAYAVRRSIGTSQFYFFWRNISRVIKFDIWTSCNTVCSDVNEIEPDHSWRRGRAACGATSFGVPSTVLLTVPWPTGLEAVCSLHLAGESKAAPADFRFTTWRRLPRTPRQENGEKLMGG